MSDMASATDMADIEQSRKQTTQHSSSSIDKPTLHKHQKSTNYQQNMINIIPAHFLKNK
jgi:hypothetical protein